jgi:hypothetical protein
MRGLQPAAEVALFNGDFRVNTVGILDSGSLFTVFSCEFAELLGIDNVTNGRRERISTLANGRDVYFFDLEIEVLAAGSRFPAQIAFFEGRAARNILGRIVIFSAFQIGFHEGFQSVYLEPQSHS